MRGGWLVKERCWGLGGGKGWDVACGKGDEGQGEGWRQGVRGFFFSLMQVRGSGVGVEESGSVS